MILVDEPRWPAHGRLWGHVVSDASLAELHAFASRAGLPPGGFDHDHYDYPIDLQPRLLDAGARLVPSGTLLRRLRAAGLRVRPQDRTPRRDIAADRLRERWDAFAPQLPELGEELIGRWGEPHRRYHDVRHLDAALAALAELRRGGATGAAEPVATWALWFHDAVYVGRPGEDERDSAALASERLTGRLPAADVAEVVRLIGLTVDHAPAASDARGAALSDADLAVLGAIPGRYDVYARDVRAEYAFLDDATFRAGRTRVLEGLLAHEALFATVHGRARWEPAARVNIAAELARLGS